VIINTGSTIDHDCTIGDYSHIAPGSTLSGHVKVGPGLTLPVGSKVGVGVDVGE
jgi:acetyltransferase EpsM